MLTVAKPIAVAWAAIFVPFLVFLNPSIPQDLIIILSPKKGLYIICIWHKSNNKEILVLSNVYIKCINSNLIKLLFYYISIINIIGIFYLDLYE